MTVCAYRNWKQTRITVALHKFKGMAQYFGAWTAKYLVYFAAGVAYNSFYKWLQCMELAGCFNSFRNANHALNIQCAYCTVHTLDIKVCPGHVYTLHCFDRTRQTQDIDRCNHRTYLTISHTEHVAQCAKWTLETVATARHAAETGFHTLQMLWSNKVLHTEAFQ